tara:strand:+ start:314 stop:1537 length:1224 start_codon:yes stop_codon:yes gene_type:complete
VEYLILFILLLILSAFFSGTETAYFHIREHRKDTPQKVKFLLKSKQSLLVTLLTGNTLINVSIASLAAYITSQLASYSTFFILLEVFFVTILILIFGEILPKMIAIKKSNEIALKLYRPLKVIMFLLKPISLVLNMFTNLVIRIIPFKREKIFDSEEELKILAALGEEEGTLKEEESDMIQSIFDFKDKVVGEIITPRVDIVSLKSDESIDRAMDIIGERQFSKIPIYKDNIDNIKGILYAKDIIPYLTGSRPNLNLLTLARQPFFVPETKPIDDLMEEFKSRKTSIAIVVDEWGGTEGLVTLEDVVEEVMGEIRDPYDKEESNIFKEGDGSFIVDASMTIYDFEEETDIQFPEERDYDTLAGLILNILTDIPKVGEKVVFNEMLFTVQTVENNRIGKIKINKYKNT